MTLRSLATSASVLALCLIGTAHPGISGELPHGQSAPFTVADAQGTAPNFTGISHWFNSAPLTLGDLRGKMDHTVRATGSNRLDETPAIAEVARDRLCPGGLRSGSSHECADLVSALEQLGAEGLPYEPAGSCDEDSHRCGP